jgi:hypothetical protein
MSLLEEHVRTRVVMAAEEPRRQAGKANVHP